MEFPETIELNLLARHVIDAPYVDVFDCAVARPMKELYPKLKVFTGISHLELLELIGPKLVFTKYKFEPYRTKHLKEDKKRAMKMEHNEVVRTLTLTLV